MMSHWHWLVTQLSRRLWVRPAFFCLLGVATALAAALVEPLIPIDVPGKIGADAVDSILTIIASSMLTVTTFSLTTMVAAFSAATANVTPRAIQLLVQDTTAQTALGTFIGSFLFGLVGIIALNTGLYGSTGRVVLFGVTILVVGFIIVTLLRWIDHLSRFGRVRETIERVERATVAAMCGWCEHPYFDARARQEGAELPPGCQPVFAESIGYVQHIDVGALSEAAKKAGVQIFVDMLPGGFADPVHPIAWFLGSDDDGLQGRIRHAFAIGGSRSFDQDPRFGLIVLSEIASRALSPGTNDPGTAIDVIGTVVRVLAIATESADADGADELLYPEVHVPTIQKRELFDDIFPAIARDGAAFVEVGVRLQRAFATLAQLGDDEYRRNALRHSASALTRAEMALAAEEDRVKLARAASALQTMAIPGGRTT